jgi:undecaprenyl-diphosphatase
MIWSAITDLGDLAVLAPIAAIVIIWLAATMRWQALAAFALSVGVCLSVTVVLKLLFLSGTLSLPGLHSPSGHASASIAIYGDLAVLTGLALRGWARLATLAATAALLGAIAISRVSLHVHSVADVVLGSTIGLVCIVLFLGLHRPQAMRRSELGCLCAAVAVTAILLHGRQFPSSTILAHLMRELS